MVANYSLLVLGCFEDLPDDSVLQKITKARLSLGLNKKEFAEMLGINTKTLWNWENEIYSPNTEKLKEYYSEKGKPTD